MRTRSFLAAAAALTLLVGACGGDDDDAAEDGSDGTVAAPEGDDVGDDGGDGSSITMVNFAFSPDSVTVASGGAVSLTNEDGSTHTFTSDDAGVDVSVSAGESAEAQVDAEAGTYDFHCEIHPSMTGTLTVT